MHNSSKNGGTGRRREILCSLGLHSYSSKDLKKRENQTICANLELLLDSVYMKHHIWKNVWIFFLLSVFFPSCGSICDGLLFPLLTYCYRSQILFWHSWLSFLPFLEGENWMFPHFQKSTGDSFTSALLWGLKEKCLELTVQTKGACWVFKMRAPLWWCICPLLLLIPVGTIYPDWILWICMFWADTSLLLSQFGLPL